MNTTLRSVVPVTLAALLAISPALSGGAVAQSSPERPRAGVFGCAAEGNQQEIGAVVGGALGGLLGRSISRDNRTAGTIAGVALGAAAGSWLGCRLQIDDQMQAQAALERALAENRDPTWAGRTGSRGSVVVISSTGGAAAAAPPPPLAPGVVPVSALDTAASGRYTARSNANLRAGPTTSSAVVGRLVRGESVRVAGQVSGQPWLLVERDGEGRGYVSVALVNGEIGAGAATTRTAAAQPVCRTLRETIEPAGASAQSQTLRACQNSDGTWDLRSA